MTDSNDSEIREAFHRKKLQSSSGRKSDSLIIDELGILHGANRIDIAVINRDLHGYEIKSSKDTLKRLDKQLESYSTTMQRLTFIIAPRHVDELLKQVPAWCGVIIAKKGPRGGISFTTLRQSKKNPAVNKFSLAHMLWKSEVKNYLADKGFESKDLNANRRDLYKLLCESLTTKELVNLIKYSLSTRESWRVQEPSVIYDGW